MKSETNRIRLFVAVFVAGGLLLASMPDAGSAQASGDPGHAAHKWKHDKIMPPTLPCPPDQRPCKWGHGTGGTNPGGNEPGGKSDLAINDILIAGMEPSPVFVDAVNSLNQANFPTPTPVPAPAQRAVFDALSGGEDPGNTALARGLTEGNEGALEASSALITAMRGLTTMDGQLPAAVDAFNGFVDASSDQFLADPSAEFLVVHSFIGALVEEAVSHGIH